MRKSLKRVLSSVLAATMLIGTVSYGSLDKTPVLNIAPAVVNAATEIGITECEGWLESAWVEWKPVSTSGVSYYAVSYSQDGSSFTKIDNQLIRMYRDGHWRADIVGLAAGSYTIKVEAFDSSDVSVSSETANVTVVPHDRTGFTFSPSSRLAYSDDPLQSGAYNGDGTLKSNANVIYITSASDIDNVTYEGSTGLSEILQNRHKQSSAPLAVRIVGKIDYSGSQLNGSGYIHVKPSKSYTDINTTIEGIGEDTAVNFGFLLRNAGNVELRNMAIHDFEDDGVSLDTDNSNIWIHNMEFFYGVQGSGDKAKGDGSSDVKNDSQYVTLSYNHYWDAGKCSLCGMKSESGDNFITYHHNWFDHSDSRHPRIRTMSVHVYNNYYDGNAKYGVGASAESSALVEGNYFRNCKYPTLQGSVGCDVDAEEGGSATFDDSPAIGAIKFVNNTVIGSYGNWRTDSDGTTSGNGDACLVNDRSQSITYTTAAGAAYNNFDTRGEQASYIQGLTIQSPEDAKAAVEKYAGKTGGGDFKEATGFAFNNSVDDVDDQINTTLRAAITNYADDNLSPNFAISSIGGSVDGTAVPTETTTSVTETTTEASTETTTEEVTEETTFSDPVEIGEAQTGFVSENPSDTGAGVSVVFNAATNSWVLTDNSGSAAAELTIPFAEQTGGKIVITGTAQPSTTASKWMFVQIRGTKADGTSGEIFGFGGGSNKEDLSVRVNGGAYNKLGTLSAKTYNYTIVIDIDNKVADVNIDGITESYNLDVASINSLYSTTSKSGERNVTVSVPYVGVLTDDVPPATETTTVTAETTTETTTVTEATTETTTAVTESSSETTTEYVPDPAPSDKVYGDVDGNGKLEINDASALIDMVLKGAVEAEDGITDVTGDGKADTADIATILQKILDNSWKMPCEPDDEDTTESTTAENISESTTEEPTEGTTSEPAPAGSYAHNFTADGTNSSFFTISGNLSTDKGTVEYNGMTFTQCLKMETATSIKFTAPSAGKLTLVFSATEGKKNCKIDEEKMDSDANGVLTVDLAAGAHEITKRDTSNLFYMVFTPNA